MPLLIVAGTLNALEHYQPVRTRGQGGAVIIRTVLCSAVLALAGLLFVALSGHLWSRYQEETAALGFSGVYERLASQVGLWGSSNAVDEGERAPLPVVREAAVEE